MRDPQKFRNSSGPDQFALPSRLDPGISYNTRRRQSGELCLSMTLKRRPLKNAPFMNKKYAQSEGGLNASTLLESEGLSVSTAGKRMTWYVPQLGNAKANHSNASRVESHETCNKPFPRRVHAVHNDNHSQVSDG
jgi:hypothetical protein